MLILLPGGHAAADMALRFVDVQDDPGPGCQRRIYVLQPVRDRTGALDSKTSREVLNFLKELNEEGNTIVMITHDNSIALEAKHVVRIHDGKINFNGDVKDYAAII